MREADGRHDGVGMTASIKYSKLPVVIAAWVIVGLAFIHRSEFPDTLGRYSWRYACLLGALTAGAATLSLILSTWCEKLYGAKIAIFMSLAALLFTIGVVEIGIRAVDLYGISYYEFVGDYMRNMVADDQLKYRHKPSWETRYGDVVISYNERGLRDRPILPKARDEFRILALGDSATFGWGVSQDQVFTVRLERMLQGRLERPVRVINSGVGGYNTVQELAYFRREGVTLQPDLVMLTYVENDIEENKGKHDPTAGSSWREMSFPDMVITMTRKLWLYRLADHVYHYALPNRKEQPSKPSRDQGWNESMAALDELVMMCNEERIPLLVFFFEYEPGDEKPLFQDVVRHAKGVAFRDMGQWFKGMDKFSLINSKVDSHPNAEAHRVMAEHMAGEIMTYVVVGK
jgi:lysophospholipase L1-like esterase